MASSRLLLLSATTCIFAFPALGQEVSGPASPFDTAPLSAAEAAEPSAPIRPLPSRRQTDAFGTVDTLDSYANAGSAGFSTSRNDIMQDIGLAPVIDLVTPKVTTKGGGF